LALLAISLSSFRENRGLCCYRAAGDSLTALLELSLTRHEGYPLSEEKICAIISAINREDFQEIIIASDYRFEDEVQASLKEKFHNLKFIYYDKEKMLRAYAQAASRILREISQE